MRIGQRLTLGFGIVLVLFGVGAGVAYQMAERSVALERHEEQVLGPAHEAASNLHRAYLEQAIQLRRVATTEGPVALARYDRAVAAERAAIEALRSLPSDPDRRAFLTELAQRRERYEGDVEVYLAAIRAHAADPAAGGESHLAELDRALFVSRSAVSDHVEVFLEAQSEAQRAALLASSESKRRLLTTLLAVGGIVVLGGGVAAYATGRVIHRRATRLVAATRDLERGDYAAAIATLPARDHGGDELVAIGTAFTQMARGLRDREWRVTTQAAVSATLAASDEVDALASGLLEALAERLPCELGAIYLVDATGARLVRAAGWGAASATESIRLGDGIPGEAAARRRMVVVRGAPEGRGDGFAIETGFTTLTPRTLLAAPLICSDRLLGVLVIGAVRDVSDEALELIEEVARQAGVSLHSALANREVRRLAADLESQNEVLQAQNEEIQTQNEEIQAQNEEILAQNEEVESQKAELAEADRQKQELISIASHELRSPLSALKLQAEILAHELREEGAPDPARREQQLARLDRTIDRLATRVDRLLDYSRAQMGRLQLTPEPTDLIALVREGVELSRYDAGDRRVTFATEVASARLALDRAYLDQAIGNLVENALRYSPEGGEVAVRVSRAGDELRVAVADRGIGIAPDKLERLFEPYVRDPEAVRVSSEGMGLGLYITRAIVRAHGGRIWADSEVGKGTTFTIALPAPAAASAGRSDA